MRGEKEAGRKKIVKTLNVSAPEAGLAISAIVYCVHTYYIVGYLDTYLLR